jgi:hypothetical protein
MLEKLYSVTVKDVLGRSLTGLPYAVGTSKADAEAMVFRVKDAFDGAVHSVRIGKVIGQREINIHGSFVDTVNGKTVMTGWC